jgi:hypothetical protein
MPPQLDNATAQIRVARLATWIFIVPALVGYVRLPDGTNLILKTSQIGLALLCMVTAYAVVRGLVRPRDLVVVAVTALALFGVLGLYTLAWPHLRGWAFAEPSPQLALAAVAFCCAAVVYAKHFYREDIFTEVFWKASVAAVASAMAAYGINEVIDSGWLVHRQYGTPRLQGFLSEPSSWAPFLSALFLLALVRKERMWLAFLLLACLLTKSPTVLLSVVGSLAGWYVVTRKRSSSQFAMLSAFLAAGALVVNWLKGVDIYRSLSTSLADQFVVRLASGVRAVTSNGIAGRNDRFTTTQAVIDELSLRGWLWTGIGPGSEGYIRGSTGMLPNALPVYVLASFGIFGVVVLAVLLVQAIIRLSTQRALCIFLSFAVASTINSAGGWESYKFVVVAIAIGAGMKRDTAAAAKRQVSVS